MSFAGKWRLSARGRSHRASSRNWRKKFRTLLRGSWSSRGSQVCRRCASSKAGSSPRSSKTGHAGSRWSAITSPTDRSGTTLSSSDLPSPSSFERACGRLPACRQDWRGAWGLLPWCLAPYSFRPALPPRKAVRTRPALRAAPSPRARLHPRKSPSCRSRRHPPRSKRPSLTIGSARAMCSRSTCSAKPA